MVEAVIEAKKTERNTIKNDALELGERKDSRKRLFSEDGITTS
jgi:hypothetical protein